MLESDLARFVASFRAVSDRFRFEWNYGEAELQRLATENPDLADFRLAMLDTAAARAQVALEVDPLACSAEAGDFAPGGTADRIRGRRRHRSGICGPWRVRQVFGIMHREGHQAGEASRTALDGWTVELRERGRVSQQRQWQLLVRPLQWRWRRRRGRIAGS